MNFDGIEVGDTVKVEGKRYSGVVTCIGWDDFFRFLWVRSRNVDRMYIEGDKNITVIKKGKDNDNHCRD